MGGAEYNPFLEEGGQRPADDEAAGLALAATIAGGGSDEEGEFNPFLGDGQPSTEPARPADDRRNPFANADDEESATAAKK